MSNQAKKNKHPSLLRTLILLTCLFIVAQLILFSIHYQVSSLIDSLVDSSLSKNIFTPIIFFPLLAFIALQIIAYVLFVAWIRWITLSIQELGHFSSSTTYWIGIFCWTIACLALLMLNNHYFPHSFFSYLLQQFSFTHLLAPLLLMVSVVLLFIATALAYLNFFYFRRHLFWGSLFLLLGLIITIMSINARRQHGHVSSIVTAKPNIILIGVDSVRPDFTGAFGNNRVHTPHLDAFLNTAATFTQAYTPLARTFPSWISILTAKYPLHSQARNNLIIESLVKNNQTLSRRLQQANYFTIYATDEKRFSNITKAYGFNRIIGPKMGLNDFLLGGLSDFPLTNLLINLPISKVLFPYNYANRAAAVTYEPDSFIQLLKAGIAKRPDKPLFLAIHLCLSHWPFSWATSTDAALPVQYADSVEAVDQQFGNVMQLLHEQGLLEHSIVVLLSDHGTTIGLPNERIIQLKNYLGDRKQLKLISVARLSAPEKIADKQLYTINTAYGQGTDVLSLKQYHTLLAFKGFGLTWPVKRIQTMSALLDIAPTLLDFLHFPPLPHADGISWKNVLTSTQQLNLPARPLYIETGDKISEIETDKIVVDKVLKKRIQYYQMDKHGLLHLIAAAETSLISNKQRAILWDNWLLARYPAEEREKLVPIVPGKPALKFSTYTTKPYYVLVNLKTEQWTIGLSSSFAKTAPTRQLMKKLHDFYGKEIAGNI